MTTKMNQTEIMALAEKCGAERYAEHQGVEPEGYYFTKDHLTAFAAALMEDAEWVLRDAAPAVALPAEPMSCVCGDPLTPKVVHRTDGPCFYEEAPAAQAERPARPPMRQISGVSTGVLERAAKAQQQEPAEPVALPVVVRPENVAATMKEMRAAYIDVIIHSQRAYAICDYIEALESALAAKGQA